MKKTLLSLIVILLSVSGHAQKLNVQKAAFYDKTAPLREVKMIVPGARDRSWKDAIIRNETDPRLKNLNRDKQTLPIGQDPLWQSQMGAIKTNYPIQNFEGTPNVNSVYPPDTDGDVGPDHYYQMINLSFQIFDKEGNSLYGPADNSTIWDGFIGPWSGTNDGDPITLYDEEADRWMVSQFAVNTSDGTYWELIAVSESGDPLGAYYRYAFEFPVFNDYPKFGIWNDAYYCSFNMFGSYNRVAAAAFERDAMLTGDPDARMVWFDLEENSEPWSMIPADFDGMEPVAGTPNYFAYIQDDLTSDADQLCIWEFVVDWDNVENSVFEETKRLDVASFDSEICSAYRGQCIHQPEDAPLLEALADRLMYRLQYRDFEDYAVMLTNHTVDVDGTGHAGIRWYELRDYRDGDGWVIHQQGTYAPDSDHRWMGSVAMNEEGFIALGYSVSSEETYPSIRYTGRGPNAPLGQMIFTEETIIDGGGVQTGDAKRWGDYSKMSVDPSDNKTFWFTTEYMKYSASVGWKTRIASFQLEEDFEAPDHVEDLTADIPTTNGVWLHWTAPDDNLGTTFLYDIRYSDNAITAENWDDATTIANTPDPQEPGVVESFYVEGLAFNHTYHFAMKVADRQYNYSGLSNNATATTPGEPTLIASTEKIVVSAKQTFDADYSYTIWNDGESDIRYFLTKTDTAQSVPGEIVETYLNSGSGVLGMHFHDDLIYLINSGQEALMIYDPAQQQIQDTIPVHESPFGVTDDGEKLWIGSKYGYVKSYYFDGSFAGDSLSFMVEGYHALTYNGEHLLLNKVNQDDPEIIKLNPETGVIDGYYHVEADLDIWQSCWVAEHQSGKLWITNNDKQIAQLMLDEETQTFSLLQQFEAPALTSYAISHNGSDILYGEIANNIRVVDDGVAEVNWLDYTPVNDTISADMSGQVFLTMRSLEFDPGVYYAEMTIHNNDQNNPAVVVPIEFTIEEYSAMQLAVEGAPEQVCAGNPLELAAMVSGGEGDYTYAWMKNSEVFGTASEVVFAPQQEAVYSLSVSDDFTTVSTDLMLEVSPSPEFALGIDTTICNYHQLNLTIEEEFVSYEWSDGTTQNAFTIDSTNSALGANTFWVRVEGDNGCKTTDSIFVMLDQCFGIEEISAGLIKIYPNPANQYVVVESGSNRMEFVKVLDASGKLIYHKTLSGNTERNELMIDVSDWKPGTYFIHVNIDKYNVAKKLIIR